MTDRLPLTELRKLPPICCLYRVYSEQTLLYLGSSTNLNKRFANHHKMKDFVTNSATHIVWQECDVLELAGLEYAQLQQQLPPLNISRGRRATISPKIEGKRTSLALTPEANQLLQLLILAISNERGRPVSGSATVIEAIKCLCKKRGIKIRG
jgi:hypothetical protein